jgi:hypothetical protein
VDCRVNHAEYSMRHVIAGSPHAKSTIQGAIQTAERISQDSDNKPFCHSH